MKFIRNYENICCNDVLQSVFELNALDLEIYKILKKTGESRADVLAKKIDRERSTVYRSLQNLTSCDLCAKTTKTIETGGYYHTYSCNDVKLVREKIESCIDEWYKQMKKILEDFEQEMS